MYLHARYYDPQLGIFLSPDRLHPTKPGVGSNRYAYGLGNPVNGTDRSGTMMVCASTQTQDTVVSQFHGFPGTPSHPENVAVTPNTLAVTCVWFNEGIGPGVEAIREAEGIPEPKDPAGGIATTPAQPVAVCKSTGECEDGDGESDDDDGDDDDDGRAVAAAQSCGFNAGFLAFRSRFNQNLDMLNESAIANVAHGVHYAEAGVGAAALLVGTQALSGGLRAGISNPLALQTGSRLVVLAGKTVALHIVLGAVAVEGGFIVGSALNAGYHSFKGGPCR